MKTPAQRQAEYRQRAWKANGRDRLTVMLPTQTLQSLSRLAKHRGMYKWEVLSSLINDAAKQLPGNGQGYK